MIGSPVRPAIARSGIRRSTAGVRQGTSLGERHGERGGPAPARVPPVLRSRAIDHVSEDLPRRPAPVVRGEPRGRTIRRAMAWSIVVSLEEGLRPNRPRGSHEYGAVVAPDSSHSLGGIGGGWPLDGLRPSARGAGFLCGVGLVLQGSAPRIRSIMDARCVKLHHG